MNVVFGSPNHREKFATRLSWSWVVDGGGAGTDLNRRGPGAQISLYRSVEDVIVFVAMEAEDMSNEGSERGGRRRFARPKRSGTCPSWAFIFGALQIVIALAEDAYTNPIVLVVYQRHFVIGITVSVATRHDSLLGFVPPVILI